MPTLDNQKIRLTSSEITSLWAQYIQDTMSVCISKYVLAKVKGSNGLLSFRIYFRTS
ncbi:DUF3231 family protein [Priestia aryabhattai]|uniref:DUF3231 family protein n=1 Tax=Priestia aryabhattai TaxID=412384 RepID=UPI0039A0B4DB